ncbi:sodium-independent sulfate anion transporter-like isoform X1 [Rhynchophorus ferrugineus]|uniref:sodium-independent sulfate anion transporter-like isoform X1 n=2 Tax=Rhynchophorus ferrugineus TaxID=354439 RepID=UPI003FCE8AE0
MKISNMLSWTNKIKMPTSKTIKKFVRKRIPILQWGPKYDSRKLLCDCIAGFTVALTVMPQALAYATLGGLQPQYGLYSAFMGCFVYTVFGSIKDITIGPTALMALMTYQQIVGRNTDYAILLCFLSGVVQLIMSILHLGVLVDFISIPVTVGFTSATSVIIGSSQFASLLGIKMTSNGFYDTMNKLFQNIHLTRFQDTLLGISCIAVLLLLRKLKDVKLNKKGVKPTKQQCCFNYIFWLISTSRNAIVVIICSTIAFMYESRGSGSPFRLTGDVKAGLPEFKLPPFSTMVNNSTREFPEMLSDLGSSVFLVPIIAVLGNVAIAKAFASGEVIDATQELLTLSLCNIIGSFFSSMPVTGSFSRSAVNHASGVQTPFGGIITGIMVLLALSFLTPYFAYIPKASLGAVVVCAVIFMIEYEVIKPMWRSSKKDLFSAMATFVCCLIIGVEYGILIGVAINIMFLLYPSARPGVHMDKCMTPRGKEYIIITPGNALYFPAMDFIKTSVARAGVSSKHLPVVIDCQFILGADFTAAKGIAALINEFSSRKQPLYFLNARMEVVSVFRGVMSDDFVNFNCKTKLEQTIEEQGNSISEEEERLLAFPSTESCGFKNVELKEISCSSDLDETVHHRHSYTNKSNKF